MTTTRSVKPKPKRRAAPVERANVRTSYRIRDTKDGTGEIAAAVGSGRRAAECWTKVRALDHELDDGEVLSVEVTDPKGVVTDWDVEVSVLRAVRVTAVER